MTTPIEDAELVSWIYDTVLQIIKSPEFRNPLKDFIDDNCGSFIGVDENTFEQGALHKEFVTLADNLLETLTQEIGITEEMFCLAAKKGLEDQKDNKKYFEQLIAFNNYTYFKNLMTKRNLHLEKIAYQEMMKDKEKEAKEEGKKNDEEIKQLTEQQNIAEKGELECAMKMSLALEEEEKKSEDLPKKLNPIDKVALKQKQLKEHDEKMKNIVQNKLSTVPVFTDKKNESLNKKLDEMEANKNKTLQEYREMILRMKKEKRHQEENEGTDILSYGLDDKDKQKGKEEPKLTEEEKQKMKNKMSLADRLKANLFKKK